MAIITSLSTLRLAALDYYNRSDLTVSSGGQMDVLIQQAEQRFQRDPRVREPGASNAVLVSLMTTDPNWLLTAEPDIYLYGTLMEMAVFLKDEERLPIFQQRYEEAADRLSGSVRLNPARTLGLSTYAELQTMVADALNRGDMKNVIPVAIYMAEGRLRTDQRVKNLTSATYSITGDDLAVPTGFRQLESWYYDSAPYLTIEIVGASMLGTLKGRYGPSGQPRYAAILGNAATFRFAPAPASTFSTKMTFWQSIPALSAGVNWLYTNYPDIYLWATLTQCGPWVKDDPRASATVEEAKVQLENALENLHLEQWNRQWSGAMRHHVEPIG